MAAALSAFQLASDLGPSPSRESELEEQCRRIAAENEVLREAVDAAPKEAKKEASLKPEEKQQLLEVISNLGHRVELLEILTAGQAREIEDLKNVNDRLERQILSVKGLAKDRIGELLKEIVDIRDAQTVDRKYVNDLMNELGEAQDLINQHAEAINKIYQVAKKAHAPNGKKSKDRVEQLKEILKGGSKTYKELERLLKISPKEMNRLVAMLDTRSYEIFFRSGDNRQKVLRLRAWKSLTSNVKGSAEEGSKVVELLKI